MSVSLINTLMSQLCRRGLEFDNGEDTEGLVTGSSSTRMQDELGSTETANSNNKMNEIMSHYLLVVARCLLYTSLRLGIVDYY